MRRDLSFILVLLLVLRGLLGDAMAMAPVAAPTAPVHHAPTASAHSTASQGEAHAVSTAQGAAATAACSAPAPDGSSEHGPACSACGICHSALSTPALLAQPLQPPSLAPPSLDSTPFTSASAVLDIKPPIS